MILRIILIGTPAEMGDFTLHVSSAADRATAAGTADLMRFFGLLAAASALVPVTILIILVPTAHRMTDFKRDSVCTSAHQATSITMLCKITAVVIMRLEFSDLLTAESTHAVVTDSRRSPLLRGNMPGKLKDHILCAALVTCIIAQTAGKMIALVLLTTCTFAPVRLVVILPLTVIMLHEYTVRNILITADDADLRVGALHGMQVFINQVTAAFTITDKTMDIRIRAVFVIVYVAMLPSEPRHVLCTADLACAIRVAGRTMLIRAFDAAELTGRPVNHVTGLPFVPVVIGLLRHNAFCAAHHAIRLILTGTGVLSHIDLAAAGRADLPVSRFIVLVSRSIKDMLLFTLAIDHAADLAGTGDAVDLMGSFLSAGIAARADIPMLIRIIAIGFVIPVMETVFTLCANRTAHSTGIGRTFDGMGLCVHFLVAAGAVVPVLGFVVDIGAAVKTLMIERVKCHVRLSADLTCTRYAIIGVAAVIALAPAVLAGAPMRGIVMAVIFHIVDVDNRTIDALSTTDRAVTGGTIHQMLLLIDTLVTARTGVPVGICIMLIDAGINAVAAILALHASCTTNSACTRDAADKVRIRRNHLVAAIAVKPMLRLIPAIRLPPVCVRMADMIKSDIRPVTSRAGYRFCFAAVIMLFADCFHTAITASTPMFCIIRAVEVVRPGMSVYRRKACCPAIDARTHTVDLIVCARFSCIVADGTRASARINRMILGHPFPVALRTREPVLDIVISMGFLRAVMENIIHRTGPAAGMASLSLSITVGVMHARGGTTARGTKPVMHHFIEAVKLPCMAFGRVKSYLTTRCTDTHAINNMLAGARIRRWINIPCTWRRNQHRLCQNRIIHVQQHHNAQQHCQQPMKVQLFHIYTSP